MICGTLKYPAPGCGALANAAWLVNGGTGTSARKVAVSPAWKSTDGSAEVRDNGRGIPVDVERKTKLTGLELVMTRLLAGGKFGGGSYTASGGLHGVGASVVNALAARLDVEVDRGGQTW